MAIEAAGARGSFNTDSHRPSSADNPETPLRRGFLFRPQMRFDQLPSCFVDTLYSRIGTLLHFKQHQGGFHKSQWRLAVSGRRD
jgi:hypothetical protein